MSGHNRARPEGASTPAALRRTGSEVANQLYELEGRFGGNCPGGPKLLLEPELETGVGTRAEAMTLDAWTLQVRLYRDGCGMRVLAMFRDVRDYSCAAVLRPSILPAADVNPSVSLRILLPVSDHRRSAVFWAVSIVP